MIDELLELQEKISAYSNCECLEYTPRISFSKIGDLFELNFYGEGHDYDSSVPSSEMDEYMFGFCSFLDFLIQQNYAEKIVSLNFTGPDSGANGTRSWNFDRIAQSDVVFPNLKKFSVALTDPGDHNTSVLDRDYKNEDGMAAILLSKMPVLECMSIPSAPDSSFFEIEDHPLRSLIVQAGYDNQNFIINLAESSNLKKLTFLDYSELSNEFDDLTNDCYTSFEDFKKLFQSEVFKNSENFLFKLRNSILSENQLLELQKIKPIQFLYINPCCGKFVRRK